MICTSSEQKDSPFCVYAFASHDGEENWKGTSQKNDKGITRNEIPSRYPQSLCLIWERMIHFCMIQTLITVEPSPIQIMNFTEILCEVVKTLPFVQIAINFYAPASSIQSGLMLQLSNSKFALPPKKLHLLSSTEYHFHHDFQPLFDQLEELDIESPSG